jgi:hypothetical protein
LKGSSFLLRSLFLFSCFFPSLHASFFPSLYTSSSWECEGLVFCTTFWCVLCVCFSLS